LLRVVQHLRPIGPREIDAAGVPLPLYELTWVPRGSDRDADDEAWRAAEEDLNQFSIDIVQAVLRDGNRPGGDKQPPLLARMLEMLPSERALAAPSGRVDVMARARALAERHPIAATEFELLGRCGSRLADVLRGACNPLELLFPASGASAAALYSTSYAA